MIETIEELEEPDCEKEKTSTVRESDTNNLDDLSIS